MVYYKEINENKDLVLLLTYDNIQPTIPNSLVIEITEEEYVQLLSDIREKEMLVWSLYREEISLNDIKLEWQEEIQKRVDEIIKTQGSIHEQSISYEDLTQMIEEVL